MSNTLYLTCKHHPSTEDSFLLADRKRGESYRAGVLSRLQKWLDKHASCGATTDHFTAGYAQQKDIELPAPALVANGVHQVLRAANEGQV
jgi:hypothetical protein